MVWVCECDRPALHPECPVLNRVATLFSSDTMSGIAKLSFPCKPGGSGAACFSNLGLGARPDDVQLDAARCGVDCE